MRIKSRPISTTVGKEAGADGAGIGLLPARGSGARPRRRAAGGQDAFQLKDGEVSEPLQSPRGPVFITVTDKKDPYVPKLEEVKDRVREDVIEYAPPS